MNALFAQDIIPALTGQELTTIRLDRRSPRGVLSWHSSKNDFLLDSQQRGSDDLGHLDSTCDSCGSSNPQIGAFCSRWATGELSWRMVFKTARFNHSLFAVQL
jgi:hypothetical protein